MPGFEEHSLKKYYIFLKLFYNNNRQLWNDYFESLNYYITVPLRTIVQNLWKNVLWSALFPRRTNDLEGTARGRIVEESRSVGAMPRLCLLQSSPSSKWTSTLYLKYNILHSIALLHRPVKEHITVLGVLKYYPLSVIILSVIRTKNNSKPNLIWIL